MKNNKHILIIGDSTGYIVRPNGKKFHTFLKENGFLSENKCDSGIVIDDLLSKIPLIVANDYDYIIIPLGINDIVPRPYNYRLFRFINKQRYYKNNFLKVFNKLNHLMNKFIFPVIIKIFHLKGNNTPKIYIKKLKILIDKIQSESNSKIIIMTIAKTSDKMLKYLPNANLLIEETNKYLRNISLNEKLFLIDVDKIIDEKKIKLIDGFHYPEEIHYIIFKYIQEIIK
jgi:hypothetical protein